jgi:hypothetical protein
MTMLLAVDNRYRYVVNGFDVIHCISQICNEPPWPSGKGKFTIYIPTLNNTH